MQVAQQAKRRRNKHSHESANEHLESDQKTIKDRKKRPHCGGGGLSSLLCAFADHNFEEEKKSYKAIKTEKKFWKTKMRSYSSPFIKVRAGAEKVHQKKKQKKRN